MKDRLDDWLDSFIADLELERKIDRVLPFVLLGAFLLFLLR